MPKSTKNKPNRPQLRIKTKFEGVGPLTPPTENAKSPFTTATKGRKEHASAKKAQGPVDPSTPPQTPLSSIGKKLPNTTITEAAQKLKMRITYARLKVQLGWQDYDFDQVQTLWNKLSPHQVEEERTKLHSPVIESCSSPVYMDSKDLLKVFEFPTNIIQKQKRTYSNKDDNSRQLDTSLSVLTGSFPFTSQINNNLNNLGLISNDMSKLVSMDQYESLYRLRNNNVTSSTQSNPVVYLDSHDVLKLFEFPK